MLQNHTATPEKSLARFRMLMVKLRLDSSIAYSTLCFSFGKSWRIQEPMRILLGF